jgi:hypothetical protein
VKRYSLTHLSNDVLRRELSEKAAKEKEATAELLAHIAEFDERKLYLPAGYPSMFAYCIGELGLSHDAAKKRIQVARAGHGCPAVFDALAAGRVHLSGLVRLAAHVNPDTVDDLLAAAMHKTNDEIERMLAERNPKAGVTARVEAVALTRQPLAGAEGAPGHLDGAVTLGQLGETQAPCHVHDCARVTPLSAEAFAVQFTRCREADQRFRYLQDLLGHQAKRSDIAEVYDRAVKELVAKMERVRFGACAKPRTNRHRASADSRYVPAEVKRAVWQRDGGQCTFVGDTGHRCEARGDVEFDHVTEFARGGEATVDGLRLRCRGHNQHTAERTFGAEFMRQKRAEAAEARACAKAARERVRAEKAERAEQARLHPHQLEVLPYLRKLGCRDGESREAAALCRDMTDASLEDRVKRALSMFGARCGRKVMPVAPAANEPLLPGGAPPSRIPMAVETDRRLQSVPSRT